MSDRTRIELAVGQIEFARKYSSQLIDSIPLDDWFRIPEGAPTHVAWQVGHLAMAQYGLTMLRIRGKEPTDAEWIANDFIRKFQKGGQPDSDPSFYPPAAEIRGVFDRVYAQALVELSGYADADLEGTLPEPYAVYGTKLGSILFCPMHEMLHAGQIGLLRRLLGHPPLR
ncbi:MAG: DinB family protein [Pirellulales bacterium]